LLPAVPSEKRAGAERALANGLFHLATARTLLHAREFRRAGLAFVDPGTPASGKELARKALLDVIARERDNVRRAIPAVEADSALGWEPMMRYVCGRPNLEWKLRQLDEAERTIKAR